MNIKPRNLRIRKWKGHYLCGLLEPCSDSFYFGLGHTPKDAYDSFCRNNNIPQRTYNGHSAFNRT